MLIFLLLDYHEQAITWEPLENFLDRSVVDAYIAKKAEDELKKLKEKEPKKAKKDTDEDEQQEEDENVTRGQIQKQCANKILMGMAAVAGNHPELNAKQMLEEVMSSTKKPRSVKTATKGMERAFAEMEKISANMPPMSSTTNDTTAFEEDMKVSPSSEASNSKPVETSNSSKPVVDPNMVDFSLDSNTAQLDPGATDENINSSSKPAVIIGLGGAGDEFRLRNVIHALAIMHGDDDELPATLPNAYPDPPENVLDFAVLVLNKKSVMIPAAPARIQWGHMYRLMGWHNAGIENRLEASTHMWTQKAHRLRPDKTLAPVDGWVWGQFMLCMFRNQLHIVLLCFRDYDIEGHASNMRLVLLIADMAKISFEAAQMAKNSANNRCYAFNTNVCFDERASKVLVVHNEHLQPFVVTEEVCVAARGFVSAYWDFLLAKKHALSRREEPTTVDDDDDASSKPAVKRERTTPDHFDPSPTSSVRKPKKSSATTTPSSVDKSPPSKRSRKTKGGGSQKSAPNKPTKGLTPDMVDNMHVINLKIELSARGLLNTGIKSDLQDRLKHVLVSSNHQVSHSTMASQSHGSVASHGSLEDSLQVLEHLKSAYTRMDSVFGGRGVQQEDSRLPPFQPTHHYYPQHQGYPPPQHYSPEGYGILPQQSYNYGMRIPQQYQGYGMMPQQQGYGMMPRQQGYYGLAPPQQQAQQQMYNGQQAPWRRQEFGEQEAMQPGEEESGGYYV